MTASPALANPPEPRVIKGINRVGLMTLVQREISRFLIVYMQTIIAPIITTLLFYTVFALAFGGAQRYIGDVPFLAFLAPGLIMMNMAQNAFSNTSSSLVIAKMQGNIVDILMPPLSDFELLVGFTVGSVVRGLVVGMATLAAVAVFVPVHIHSWSLILVFALLGAMLMGSLGFATGIWSEKFDHLATVTNFIITPLTFLSGTFYSVNSLPEFWRGLALYNPFFYMIDGFRAGFIGHADGSILTGILLLVSLNILLAGLVLWMLRTGYKMKS
jgi:ABC-2 type transport system permease protein